MAVNIRLSDGDLTTVNGFTLPQILEKITEFQESDYERGFIKIDGTDPDTGAEKTKVIFIKYIVSLEETQ